MDAATPRPEDPSPPYARWLLAAILLLALGLRLLDFAEPWSGTGFKTAFGTVTTGAYAKNYYDYGFLETGFLSYYSRIELADGSLWYDWYTHHPVLYAVLSGLGMVLFGPVAWAAKLPWLIFSMLGIVSVYRFFRLVWGERAALIGAFLLAVIPLSSWYATLPWCDTALVFLYGVLGRHYVLWMRTAQLRRLVAVAATVFALGLFDWAGLFLLPSLGLHAAWVAFRRARWRGLLELAVLPAAALLAIGLHKLHLGLVLPAEFVSEDTRATLARTMTMPVPLSKFLNLQLQYFQLYFTVPVAGLILLGLGWTLVRAVRGRLSAEAWLVLVFLPPGLIYVFLFPARSVNHDFFLFISLPAFAMLAATPLVALGERLRGRAPELRFAIPLLLVGVGALCTYRHYQVWEHNSSERLPLLLEQEWIQELICDRDNVLVVSEGDGLLLYFDSDAPILNDANDARALEAWRRTLLSRLGPARRVTYLFDLHYLAYPEGREFQAFLEGIASASEQHLEQRGLVDDPIGLEAFDITAWCQP